MTDPWVDLGTESLAHILLGKEDKKQETETLFLSPLSVSSVTHVCLFFVFFLSSLWLLMTSNGGLRLLT